MFALSVIDDGKRKIPLGTSVVSTKRMPLIFQIWMAEVARDHLRLGVYFNALAIMLQIPGAAEYEFSPDNKFIEDVAEVVGRSDNAELLDGLGACLDRLGVWHLLAQVPGGADRERGELDDGWLDLLNRQAQIKHGLLHIVAECLDKLIVEPGMKEIEQSDVPHWWQRWRPRRP